MKFISRIDPRHKHIRLIFGPLVLWLIVSARRPSSQKAGGRLKSGHYRLSGRNGRHSDPVEARVGRRRPLRVNRTNPQKQLVNQLRGLGEEQVLEEEVEAELVEKVNRESGKKLNHQIVHTFGRNVAADKHA
jgi:hypothetical protein